MKPQLRECAYCGEMAITTVDHIPPRTFYDDPLPPNNLLPKVNACNKCHNENISRDDEYFHHVLIQNHLVSDLPQTQPFLQKMFRAVSNPRKRKYAEATLRSMAEAEVSTFGGIYLGRKPAFRIDRKRLERTAVRYLKGLHLCVFGSRVGDDAEIRAIINPEALSNMRNEFLGMFASGRWVVVQKKTFAFKYGTIAERPGGSAWLLVFYENFPIFGYIRPPAKS